MEDAARRAWLGVRSGSDSAGAKLVNVFEGSPAQAAGLSSGDVLIAVNGIKTGKDNLEKLISQYAPGEHITVHAFRRDELMVFDVALQAAPRDTCVCVIRHDAEEDALTRRRAWIGH